MFLLLLGIPRRFIWDKQHTNPVRYSSPHSWYVMQTDEHSQDFELLIISTASVAASFPVQKTALVTCLPLHNLLVCHILNISR